MEKIFDKFYWADSARNSDGMGLGLYICRKFMEEMKGSISAHSDGDRLTIKVKLTKNQPKPGWFLLDNFIIDPDYRLRICILQRSGRRF